MAPVLTEQRIFGFTLWQLELWQLAVVADRAAGGAGAILHIVEQFLELERIQQRRDFSRK